MAITKKLEALESGSSIVRHIQRLFSFYRHMHIVPGYFFVAMIFSLFSVFFNLVGLRLLFPLIRGMLEGDFTKSSDKLGIIKKIADAYPDLIQGSNHFLILLLGMILSAVIIKCALDYSASLMVGFQMQKANANIRNMVIQRALKFGKGYYDQLNMGSANQIIVGSAGAVTGQLMPLYKLTSTILTLFAYLMIMAFISFKLTVFCLCIFPIFHFATQGMVKRIRNDALKHEDTRLNFTGKVLNVMTCMTLVKSYATERLESLKLIEFSQEEVLLRYEMLKKQLLIKPVQELLTVAVMLMIVGAISWTNSSRGSEHMTSYIIFFFIVRRAMPSFGAITNFRITVANAEAQMTRLNELMSDEGKFVVQGGKKVLQEFKREIHFSDLKFSYDGKNQVLNGVDFTVKKGQMTAIVGPSGVGKTTLVHLLVRLYDCPDNTIFIDGVDIRSYTLESIADHIALVTQDPMLFNDTLRNNLIYGIKAGVPTDEEVYLALEEAQIKHLVEKLPDGLDSKVGERGARLSGGERQRIALARALLKNADILILDEATSALDSKTEYGIQKTIEKVISGKTAIVIAHRLSTVAMADQIVLIENGQVCEKGALNTLLQMRGRFSEYWNLQDLSNRTAVH